MQIIRSIGLRPFLTIIAGLCLGLATAGLATAGPARGGETVFVQPDGTTFRGRIQGDEFMKITTTASGYVIKQGSDGWYYYAYYDADGVKTATEWKVGSQAPADVLSACMNIPYEQLAAAAKERRTALSEVRMRRSAGKPMRAGRMSSPATKTSTVPAQKRGVVILAQFSDESFEYTRTNFDNMLNLSGYSYNGATGSVKDYFDYQFDGGVEFFFDVSPIVTLPHGYAYYGANDPDDNDNDIRPAQMVADACSAADSYIDFSKYDYDEDGEVDYVYVFYAGGDEAAGAGDDRVWAHSWYVKDGGGVRLTLDGVLINAYACSSELSTDEYNRRYFMTGIGTFCHEFSHVLGLYDYYDTDYEYSGGTADAMYGTTSLMDSGNYNNNGNTPPNYNAVDYHILELGTGELITTPGEYILEPIDVSRKYYYTPADADGEYYIFECRRQSGWDAYIGGSGLMIYHVDASDNKAGFSYYYDMQMTAAQRWTYNELNCNPAHQCAYSVAAYHGARTASQVFFPYRDVDSFTPYTEPAFQFWSGEIAGFALTDIAMSGDAVTFKVSEITGLAPTPRSITHEVYQDAAIIQWIAPLTSTVPYVTLKSGSKEIFTKEASVYDAGRYSFVCEGLSPSTAYTAVLYFKNEDGVSGQTKEVKFTTSATRSANYPFIYMRYVNEKKTSSGVFPSGTRLPLRLYNAVEAKEIIWKYNGERVSVSESGYFVPEVSGTLSAEIYYEDGGVDVVTKEIVIQ